MAGDLTELLASVQRLLASTQQGQPGQSGESGQPAGDAGAAEQPALKGTGGSPSGLITAVATAGGRIESVDVDPRGLRMDSQTLGAEVAAAVNAALDDLRTKTNVAPDGVDLTALNAELTRVRDESARQFHSFLESIAAAQERVTADRR